MEDKVLEKAFAVFHPITVVPEEDAEAIDEKGEDVSLINTVGWGEEAGEGDIDPPDLLASLDPLPSREPRFDEITWVDDRLDDVKQLVEVSQLPLDDNELLVVLLLILFFFLPLPSRVIIDDDVTAETTDAKEKPVFFLEEDGVMIVGDVDVGREEMSRPPSHPPDDLSSWLSVTSVVSVPSVSLLDFGDEAAMIMRTR